MLEAIETLHSQGFIHRDIKPENFALGRNEHRSQVYLIDFGLAKSEDPGGFRKLEGNCSESLVWPASGGEFKGTVRYASVNAHRRRSLCRGDDLWSFYFIMLEFLRQPLPWKDVRCTNREDVAETVGNIKAMCLAEPEKYLWTNPHTRQLELRNIFESIRHLAYSDRPNYEYIHQQLVELLMKEKVCGSEPQQDVPSVPYVLRPNVYGCKRKLTKEESKGLHELSAAAVVGGKAKIFSPVALSPNPSSPQSLLIPIALPLKLPPLSVFGLGQSMCPTGRGAPMQRPRVQEFLGQLNTLIFPAGGGFVGYEQRARDEETRKKYDRAESTDPTRKV